MSQEVLDAIAEETARLAREVTPPLAPLGYGVDLSCVTDITPDLEEVDAFSPLGIAQASIRRLSTPRGSLPDEPDYGIDVRGYANRGVTEQELGNLQAEIGNEVTKDDRVESARVVVTRSGSALSIQLELVPADPALGTFTATVSVTSAEVVLEAIR